MVEIPVAVPPPPDAPPPRPRRIGILAGAAVIAAVLGLSAGGLWLLAPRTAPETGAQAALPNEPAAEIAVSPAAADEGRAETASAETPPFDYEAVNALRSAMLETAAAPSSARFAVTPDPVAPPTEGSAVDESAVDVPESPPVAESAPAVPSVRTVPLPVARPPQFRGPVAAELPRRVVQPRRARTAAAAPAAPMEDTRPSSRSSSAPRKRRRPRRSLGPRRSPTPRSRRPRPSRRPPSRPARRPFRPRPRAGSPSTTSPRAS